MITTKQKQEIVKWIYQVGLDYLEDVRTYEDSDTFQQTQMNIMGFIGSEIPQKINDLKI